MRVIADSGPLIHLAAVSQFELLRLYCSELLVPHAVFREVVEVGRGQPGSRETEAAEQSGWIAITHLKETARIELFLRVGASPSPLSF